MKLLTLLMLFTTSSYGQANGRQFDIIYGKLDSLAEIESDLVDQLEVERFKWIMNEMNTLEFPKGEGESIRHSAMALSYNESHEQANWVMHLILPAIIYGNVSRTNDFREDELVKTGTAQEVDYFLKTLNQDSSYTYDGFGFDRGHLAPSADFRWSPIALSESYYYSNMSPQIGDFNREKWAELENDLREYVISNNVHIAIVTAPVLSDDLPKIERSVNKVSIPKLYVKVALDVVNKRGIAYVMPNQKILKPLEAYAVSIDSAETLLGYDLFAGVEDQFESDIESSFDYQLWMPADRKGDVLPIVKRRLPKSALSTESIHVMINSGRKHTVCGKVVSTKKHEKGHVFINLDMKFPNQVFSVSIFESNIHNFSYQPHVYLMDKEVCFTGEISDYNKTANMVIENEKKVKLLGDY
ncbi:MAG: endonuclease G [Arenicella sp.]|jgi:endonuclease G